MENQEQFVIVTLTREEYQNLQVFLKSINMVRLSQNFDTDTLSLAIAQTVQTIASASNAEDTAETVSIRMNTEMQKNIEVFLQNLNLARISQNVDTVSLSVAVVQVAQAIRRGVPEETEGPSAPTLLPTRIQQKATRTKKNPTRNEESGIHEVLREDLGNE